MRSRRSIIILGAGPGLASDATHLRTERAMWLPSGTTEHAAPSKLDDDSGGGLY